MRVIKPSIAAAALLIATVGAQAQGQSSGEKQGQSSTQNDASSGGAGQQQAKSESDMRFLKYAAQDNQAEIQICLVAEKQASSPSVKAFARLMVDDHVAIESRLAALINGLDVTVPNGFGKEGEDTLHKLEPLKGSQFDTQFLKAQVEDHSNDIKKFTEESKDTKNRGIRRFASETIDILKQHLALAEAVQSAQKDAPAGDHDGG